MPTPRSPSRPSEKRLAEWATVIGGNVPDRESEGDPSELDRAT